MVIVHHRQIIVCGCALLAIFRWTGQVEAAVLKGIIYENEVGTRYLADVQVSAAAGASPVTSGSNGVFALTFENKKPGDRVLLTVQREGYVVVHDIMLHHNLPSEPDVSLAEILLCKPGDRDEMAVRYFRLKGLKVVQESYDRRLKELESRHQADAASRGRLQKELAEAKAAAEKVAEQLAREKAGSDSEMYQKALRLFLDGRIDQAIEVLDEVELERRKTAAIQRVLELARDYRLRGQLLTLKFRFAEAEKAYQAAVGLAPNDSAAYFDLARFLQSLNHQKEALTVYERCLRIARQNEDQANTALTLNNLGALHHDESQMAEARKAFEEALKIYRQLAEGEPDRYLPGVAMTLNNLGALHYAENRMAEARKAYEEALKISRQFAERNRDTYLPQVANTLNNLGILHHDANRMVEACAAHEEALKIRRQFAESNPETYSPDVARTLNNLGVLHSDENRMAEARRAYEESLTIRRQLAQRNPDTYLPEVASTLINLGGLHRADNRMAEAHEAFAESLTIRRQLAERNPDAYLPDVAAALNNLGALYFERNRMAGARKALQDALKIYRQFAQRNPDMYLPYVGETLANLGLLHRSENEKAEARQDWEEALKIFEAFAQISPARYQRQVVRVKGLLESLDKPTTRQG